VTRASARRSPRRRSVAPVAPRVFGFVFDGVARTLQVTTDTFDGIARGGEHRQAGSRDDREEIS
jgi:hypothetical protein